MKSIIKRGLCRLLCGLGVAAAARRWQRRRVAVLMYHGVVADNESLAEGDWLQVRASEFRRQMAWLARHYRVIGFDEALAGGAEGEDHRPCAIISFDDGYANNYRVALPILADFGLKATVFVATGRVGSEGLFWWDRLHLAAAGRTLPMAEIARFKALPAQLLDAEVDAYIRARGWHAPSTAPAAYRSLSFDELQALLQSARVEIGSHTHGHQILENLSEAETVSTLSESCAFLRRQGIVPRYFAAPNGDYLDAQIPLMQAAGLQICVATRAGLWLPATGNYRIPRIGIGRGCNLAEFEWSLSGIPAALRAWREGAHERG